MKNPHAENNLSMGISIKLFFTMPQAAEALF